MARGDFKVVTHPEQQPAVCFITGSAVGPFIDTGIDVIIRRNPNVPFERQRVYISQAVIENFAQLLGFEGTQGVSDRLAEGFKAQGKIDFMNEGLSGVLVSLGDSLARIVAAADRGGDDLAGAKVL